MAEQVLVVCRENKGRSQVAQAFFERYAPEVETKSAGLIIVGDPSEPLHKSPETRTVIEVMKSKYEIDLSSRTRTSFASFDESTLRRFALIVIMAEPTVVPEELYNRTNAHAWPIIDLKDQNRQNTSEIIDEIETGVQALIRQYDLA